jgi:NTE family protein
MPLPKTALIQSGGGAKGAWEAGVMRYLAEYDIVPEGVSCAGGTSVGVMGTVALAHFAPGSAQMKQAAAFANKCWKGLSGTQGVHKNRFPPYLAALWSPSVKTADGLERYLNEVVNYQEVCKSGVEIALAAVDLCTGDLVYLDHRGGKERLVKAMMASTSIPGAFPPVELDAWYFTDGGVKAIAPVSWAVRQGCDRVIVIGCRKPGDVAPKNKASFKSTLDVLSRCLDIMESEILLGDIDQARLVNRLVDVGAAPGKKKLQIETCWPSQSLGDPLDFDPKLTEQRMELGFEDARVIWAT